MFDFVLKMLDFGKERDRIKERLTALERQRNFTESGGTAPPPRSTTPGGGGGYGSGSGSGYGSGGGGAGSGGGSGTGRAPSSPSNVSTRIIFQQKSSFPIIRIFIFH